MNLFILDEDPIKAAEYYQDLHVNKIIIEGSQLLAAAYPLERLAQEDCPRTQKGTPRVHGHYNHPMSKWVRQNTSNFDWTIKHIWALKNELNIVLVETISQRVFSNGLIIINQIYQKEIRLFIRSVLLYHFQNVLFQGIL